MTTNPLFPVYQVASKIRYGEKYDGGYVIAEIDGGYDCYISAGIANEESFSRDFLANHAIPKDHCFGFDGTIEEYPSGYTDNIQFIKKNILHINDEYNTDMSELIDQHSSIFLKMDIEGGEYPWILHLSKDRLERFKQIVIEFHGIMGGMYHCNWHHKMACLEKLASTHFIVHIHGNNYGDVVNGIPDVVEITYVRKTCFETDPVRDMSSYPVPGLDYPNDYHHPDLDLMSLLHISYAVQE
jgi:hypothetical protein